MDVEKLEENIGKKCRKRPLDDKNIEKYKLKPFKSGFKVNTIKGVIRHPKLEDLMAYTFEEDESYVECRRCEIIEPKIQIKTKEEIFSLEPNKPNWYLSKVYLSNLLFFLIMIIPAIAISLSLFLAGILNSLLVIFCVPLILVVFMSFFMSDNTGPIFTDRYFKIHYYKKKKKIWNKWWYETSRYIQYLEYKKKHEER